MFPNLASFFGGFRFIPDVGNGSPKQQSNKENLLCTTGLPLHYESLLLVTDSCRINLLGLMILSAGPVCSEIKSKGSAVDNDEVFRSDPAHEATPLRPYAFLMINIKTGLFY